MQVQQDLPHIDSVSLMWLEVQEVQTLQLAAGVCRWCACIVGRCMVGCNLSS